MREQRLTQATNPASVELHIGDRLIVDLAENGATGYVWSTDNEVPVLAFQERKAQGSGSQAIGAGRTITFTWTARAMGEGQLRLKLSRSWENEPIERWEAHVRVTG